MTTYEKIKNLCRENNLTIAKLEKALGFGNGSIAKHKAKNMKNDRLVSIANYFNVTLDYLLDDELTDSEQPKHKGTIYDVLDNPAGTGKSNIFSLKDVTDNDKQLEVLKADELFVGMARRLMELYEPRNQEEINHMLKQFSSYARASQKTRQIIDGILKMEEEEN